MSLDGKHYFYTNPLRISADFPYTMRWSKVREEYIKLCNCCPPNTLRTICEAQNYAYTMSDDALWCNLYGESELTLGRDRRSEYESERLWPCAGL